MLHINEYVNLKANWSDTIHEVCVISFVQKIDNLKDIIEMTFKNNTDGKEYLYCWTGETYVNRVCVLHKGEKIDNKELYEIARQLSCWYRSKISPTLPIETF